MDSQDISKVLIPQVIKKMPVIYGDRLVSNEAIEVLDKYRDLLLPVKVDDIANRCGVCILPLEDSLWLNYSGMASIDKDSWKKVIYYYNPNESENRQSFTIAHELGHHMLGHTLFGNMFRDNFKDGIYHPEEVAAHSFAAEVLMPSRAILRLAGSKKFRTEYDLAVLFNV